MTVHTAPSETLPVKVALAENPLGFLETLRTARGNLLGIVPELCTRQPMVTGKTWRQWHLVCSPKALKRIMRDKVEQYPKSLVTKRILEPAVRESLFIAEGAHWRWQRRAAAPVFSARSVNTLIPVMQVAAEQCVKRLQARDGAPTDLYDEMVAATFDIICNVTLSGGGDFSRRDVHDAVNAYISTIGKVSILDMIAAPRWIPRPAAIIGPNSLRKLHAIADGVVEARLASGPPTTPDLLDLLIAAEDPETSQSMSPRELRDNLLAFIVAGHETTALALSWSLYLLGKYPHHQARARDEADKVLGSEMIPQEEHLSQLPFIKAVIEEAMRLYPPAALLSRTAMENDRLCGRRVDAGDVIMLPIYALHRHRMLWSDPDAFVPERFMTGKPERFSYLPFGDGPRICIGTGFAMMEAQIILAAILRQFEFDEVPDRVPKPTLHITLRPEGGVWLRPRQRS